MCIDNPSDGGDIGIEGNATKISDQPRIIPPCIDANKDPLARDINNSAKKLGVTLPLNQHISKSLAPTEPLSASVSHYLSIANIIKSLSLTNYRQVRIPIKSDSNIKAWKKALT